MSDSCIDVDFMLTGKMHAAEDIELSNEIALSFIDMLAHYNDKIDPRQYATELSSHIGDWLQAEKKEIPDARPYVAIVDLNNDEASSYENKPKNAIEVGINVEF